jgi:hypothetical protein
VKEARVAPAAALVRPGWTKRRHVDLCRTQTTLCR